MQSAQRRGSVLSYTRGPSVGEAPVGLCVRVRGGFRAGLGLVCLILLSLSTTSPRAYGDAVFGEVFPFRQPDGTRIEVRVWGDEFYRVVESLDGYTLVGDPNSGAACYAHLSPDGNDLISTGVPVGSALRANLELKPHIRINRASARAKADAVRAQLREGDAAALAGSSARVGGGPPNLGDVEGIVLLVDFAVDEPWSIPPSEIDDYCNQVGYTGYENNGSVRDYFYDVSDGNLTYTNFVPTSYYRASQPRSYYEDRNISFGVRARELLVEALSDLDSQGFDFSQYDSNGDGDVDGINLFYAGTRKPFWAEGLWPHSSGYRFYADGVSTYRYQMTDIGDSLRLRTFCHENGHMICYWPDLYDYGYESTGVGQFCLMCYGASNTNPSEPCAYLKNDAGWSTTTTLSTPQAGLSVPAGLNTSYRYLHPTLANEFFMIENRQQTGRDSAIPDAGLAIWHIDEQGSNNNEQMTPLLHYKVTLVQADGDWDLENDVNSGDDTDLWSSPGYTECAPGTIPNTGWWDGSASGLVVTNVSASASTMTFDFNIDCNNNGTIDEAEIPTACGGSCSESCDPDCNCDGVPDACQLVLNDCNQNSIPDDCDIALGPDTDCNSNGVPDWCDVTGAGVKLDEDFEGGLPGGWSVTGGFQITSLCGDSDPDCGGSGWGYAGETSTCTYGDYEFRELIAPPVTLGYGLSDLRFCSRIETEADWDFGRVRVNGESVWEDSGLTGVWEEQVVDLRAFAGRTVTITFEFSTDTNTSGWLGWQVDNVYLDSGTPDDDGDGVPDECGACCMDHDCEQLTQALCQASEGGEYRGDGTTCEAECPVPIPTVSEWGLVVLSVALLTAGSVVLARRKRPMLN